MKTRSNRRTWVFLGLGGAATALGAMSYLSRDQATPNKTGAAPAGPHDALFDLVLPDANGREVRLSTLRGHWSVLNFWATWCPPCVKELPDFDRFAREWAPKGWRVMGLAIDKPDAVRSFLQRTPVSFPTPIDPMGGSAWSRQLGNLAGGLPFTVVFNPRGEIVQRRPGETPYDQLVAWAQAHTPAR